MIDISFGESLRLLREARKYTQVELATKVGIYPQTLYKYEHGTIPRSATVGKLTKALGIPFFFIDQFRDSEIRKQFYQQKDPFSWASISSLKGLSLDNDQDRRLVSSEREREDLMRYINILINTLNIKGLKTVRVRVDEIARLLEYQNDSQDDGLLHYDEIWNKEAIEAKTDIHYFPLEFDEECERRDPLH